MNCSNPKAGPPVGGAAGRQLQAASEGALHDLPSHPVFHWVRGLIQV